MQKKLRIGTRDSQLAVWQATLVQNLLKQTGIRSELVYMKSEGDIDTITPLYALGVTGVFTKTLDAALLNSRIDIAVHSMKDVPTQMAQGLVQAAVLARASYKDIFVYKKESIVKELGFINGRWEAVDDLPKENHASFILATGSIRRIAQWLHRYPQHTIENLRGNVNTRLQKLESSNWAGAIFAAAGLERIHLRPQKSVDLDWMLPAPAQGAVMVVCRENDADALQACQSFNDENTTLCTKVEREFLSTLLGGCSTPISALAEVKNNQLLFKGNVVSPDGSEKVEIEKLVALKDASDIGKKAGEEILAKGGQPIVARIRKTGLSAYGEV